MKKYITVTENTRKTRYRRDSPQFLSVQLRYFLECYRGGMSRCFFAVMLWQVLYPNCHQMKSDRFNLQWTNLLLAPFFLQKVSKYKDTGLLWIFLNDTEVECLVSLQSCCGKCFIPIATRSNLINLTCSGQISFLGPFFLQKVSK